MNSSPALYDSTNEVQQGVGAKLIAEVLANNGDKLNDLIVDIGCGSGNSTSQLVAQIPHRKIIGFDYKQEMIEFANDHYEKDDIEFRVGDASAEYSDLKKTIGVNESEVDIITSIMCLHWIEKDLDKTVESISKMLKPGGKAYLAISHGYFINHMADFVQDTKWSYLFKESNFQKVEVNRGETLRNKWSKFCSLFDLELVSFETVKDSNEFRDYDHFEGLIRLTSYVVGYVPESDQEEFMVDLLRYFRNSDAIKKYVTQKDDGKVIADGSYTKIIIEKPL